MHRFVYLLLFIALPLSATAQLDSGYRFQAIATDVVITNSLWNLAGEKKQEIYATKMIRSLDYQYNPGPTITFYGDRVDVEGQPIPEAIVNVPEGATRLLLLFTKLEEPDERGLTYRVFAMKDDVNSFAFGSFRFVNTSQRTIAIDLEGEQFVLKQGATRTLKVEPPELGDLSIRIAAPDAHGDWKPNYTNGWSHRSNLRTLVFITDSLKGRVKPLRYRQTEPTQ
jgi:hypothetical protein